MFRTSMTDITNRMFVELGRPNPETELSKEDMEKQWKLALDEFNELVGNWQLRLLQVTAGEQRYNIEEWFPALYVRKVLDVYYNADSTLNSIMEEYKYYYNPYYYSYYSYYDYDSEGGTNVAAPQTRTTDCSYNLLEDIKAKCSLVQRDFNFISPTTLILLPAPHTNGTVLLLVQEDYTYVTLPDQYELIVTDYAIGRCQRILANARTRLATPMRSGDFIKHAVRNREYHNVGMWKEAHEIFKQKCDIIVTERMM